LPPRRYSATPARLSSSASAAPTRKSSLLNFIRWSPAASPTRSRLWRGCVDRTADGIGSTSSRSSSCAWRSRGDTSTEPTTVWPATASHRTTTLPSRRFTKLARVSRRHTTSANLPVTGLTIFHFVIQFREIAPPLLHALVFQMFEIVLRSRCHKQCSGAEVD
jgi:hypothetical protein